MNGSGAASGKNRLPGMPNLTLNALKKSRALAGNPDIRAVFTSQNGTGYARLAMRGLLDGDAVNYDGETDITATSTKTFEQGMVVVGRAKAWTEKDFSYDIIGAHDAYALGAKVSHKEKHWTSTVANNVWEPGVYGWEEATDGV